MSVDPNLYLKIVHIVVEGSYAIKLREPGETRIQALGGRGI